MTESGQPIIEIEPEPAEVLTSVSIEDLPTTEQESPVSSHQEETVSSSVSQPKDTGKQQKPETNQDRDSILDASLNLFAEKGVYQTSLVDISTQAKLSKASLYKHFQNKEAIAETLHCDLIQRLDQTIADIDENNTTSLGCLRSIVEFSLDLTEQAPAVAQLLFCPRDNGLIHNRPSAEFYPAYQQMIDILKAGMDSGELERVQPKLAYCTFMGLLCSVIKLHLEGELNGSLNQHINDVWYPIWRALGKNPNRPG